MAVLDQLASELARFSQPAQVIGVFAVGWAAGVMSRFASTWLTDARHDRRDRSRILRVVPSAWPQPSGPGVNVKMLAEWTGLTNAGVLDHIRALEKAGKVAGRSRTTLWYRLPPGHEDEARRWLETPPRPRVE